FVESNASRTALKAWSCSRISAYRTASSSWAGFSTLKKRSACSGTRRRGSGGASARTAPVNSRRQRTQQGTSRSRCMASSPGHGRDDSISSRPCLVLLPAGGAGFKKAGTSFPDERGIHLGPIRLLAAVAGDEGPQGLLGNAAGHPADGAVAEGHPE